MDTTTDTKYEALLALTPDAVEDAYMGRAGRCACGCLGTYLSEADEIVPILRRVQSRARKAMAGTVEDLWVHTYESGATCWAYQTTQHLLRVESKAVSA